MYNTRIVLSGRLSRTNSPKGPCRLLDLCYTYSLFSHIYIYIYIYSSILIHIPKVFSTINMYNKLNHNRKLSCWRPTKTHFLFNGTSPLFHSVKTHEMHLKAKVKLVFSYRTHVYNISLANTAKTKKLVTNLRTNQYVSRYKCTSKEKYMV